MEFLDFGEIFRGAERAIDKENEVAYIACQILFITTFTYPLLLRDNLFL